MKKHLIVAFTACLLAACMTTKDYFHEPQTKMDKRMKWFKEAKYGMFIHFGLYSQLGGVWDGKDTKGYSEWIQWNRGIQPADYIPLTKTFNPENFDAEKIAATAEKAGMKYLVITTKHHEGFCLWDSKYTDYDVANTPFKGRDLLKELSKACKKHQIKFGTYYSLLDWHFPLQTKLKNDPDAWILNKNDKMMERCKEEYRAYMKNQIKELITKYDTDILWFDGDWVNWWTLEDGVDLYQYIRSLKPSIIINNRVGKRAKSKKDFGTPEQAHLNKAPDYYWEACYTMNDSWGFKKSDHNWKNKETVYKKLKDINNKGGNLLLNVGPDGEGVVPEECLNILINVGQELK